ncbi:hypothetical protein [Nonomuraea endophytica]|uniref:Uncharacterized protein n=1 Tax=Nonomuraea endophytica TaxID=714136 RepID=A0A7W7ZYW2_9ACTN|nr:hypothetical protein [Nonomuraea endophytica]MBB5075979.1 hypothetical protein [Nonomuraea endophytica]
MGRTDAGEKAELIEQFVAALTARMGNGPREGREAHEHQFSGG